MGDVPINQEAPQFAEIFNTTWVLLVERYYLTKQHQSFGLPPRYVLSSNGWLNAMAQGKHNESAEFKERIGKLMSCLKDKVKGREKMVFAKSNEIADECGLPHGFVWNVIDSLAITYFFERETAYWHDGSSGGNLIDIPIHFGQERIFL